MASDLPVVVIPTHRRRDLLAAAVASARPAPVVVVDDSPQGLSRLPGPHWLRTTGSVGFARAANLGLAHAARTGHRAALVLNDDAVLEPGCLDTLAREWRARGGVVGPVLRDPSGAVQSAGFRLARWGRLAALRSIPADVARVDAVSGACLLVGTTWRFDPGFSHGMEDIELCRRVRAAGASVRLCPRATCRHEGGATLSTRSPAAQRQAVAGHLRLVGGGVRTVPVLALALAQVGREGGPVGRIGAVLDGYRDHRRRAARVQSP